MFDFLFDFFLTYDIKNYYLPWVISVIFTMPLRSKGVIMLYLWRGLGHACPRHVRLDFLVQFLCLGPFLSNCKG